MSDDCAELARQTAPPATMGGADQGNDQHDAEKNAEPRPQAPQEQSTLESVETATPNHFMPLAVVADWRLALLCLALLQGLCLSMFWVLRRLPLPFFLYGQFFPVGTWLLASWLPESVATNWHRMRGASLIVAGLSPFLTWYLRSDGNDYFSVCVLLLLIAVVWLWMETLLLLHETAVRIQQPRLARMLSRSMSLLLYGVLVPVGAGHVALLLLGVSAVSHQAFDLRLVWLTHPRIVGDLMKILTFWGGCQVLTACVATLLLKIKTQEKLRENWQNRKAESHTNATPSQV